MNRLTQVKLICYQCNYNLGNPNNYELLENRINSFIKDQLFPTYGDKGLIIDEVELYTFSQSLIARITYSFDYD